MRVLDLMRRIAVDVVRPTFVDEHERTRKSRDIAARLVGLPTGIVDYVRATSSHAETSPPQQGPVTQQTADDGYVFAIQSSALSDGESRVVEIDGAQIAVFRIDDSSNVDDPGGSGFYATTNMCPHAAGPIGEGQIEGTCVTCPYHGWTFDIPSGRCVTIEGERLRTYPTKVVDGRVLVKLH